MTDQDKQTANEKEAEDSRNHHEKQAEERRRVNQKSFKTAKIAWLVNARTAKTTRNSHLAHVRIVIS